MRGEKERKKGYVGVGNENVRVRKHHGKAERERSEGRLLKSSSTRREKEEGRRKREGLRKKERGRVKRRKWTVNRSPHGNKTAREQRGREEWKRSRTMKGRGAGERKERRNGKVGVTQRKRKE